MAVEVPGFSNGICTASADLSAKQYTFVRVSGPFQVAGNAVPGGPVIGILQNNPKVGLAAQVMVDGISKLLVNAPISAGGAVMSDGAGMGVPALAGYAPAVALEEATAAGQVITVQLGVGRAAA